MLSGIVENTSEEGVECVDRTDRERMFSEADRWTLGNLLSRSADFCMSLASFHNNMFLTAKEAGRFLKNAAVQ